MSRPVDPGDMGEAMPANTHSWSTPELEAGPPPPRLRIFLTDAAIGVGLFVLSVLALMPFPPPEPWAFGGWPGRLLTFTVAFVPLAWRRIAPEAAHITLTVGLLILAWFRVPAQGNTTLIAIMITTYGFAAYSRRHPWLAWPLAIAPLLLGMGLTGGTFFFVMPIVCVEMGMVWFFGYVQRRRLSVARALEHRALQLDGPADDAAMLTVAEDRGRIARDLQTVVSVAVDSMVETARVAGRLLKKQPSEAQDAADIIGVTGRAAMQELRRLLSILRGPEAEGQPAAGTLGELPVLTGEAIRAGLEVELALPDGLGTVAMPTQRTAYRLAEIALQMADDRDAAGTVQIEVTLRDKHLHIRATAPDSGAAADPAPVAPFDPRIAALHERVSLVGGELRTHLGLNGGFELEARLPADEPDGSGIVVRLPQPTAQSEDDAQPGMIRRSGRAIRAIGRRPWAQDLGIVLVLATISLPEVLLFPEPLYEAERSWRAVLAVYLIAATLLARRRFPVAALVSASVMHLMHDVLSLRWTNVMLLIFAVHVFTVASRRTRVAAVTAIALALAAHGIFLAKVVTGAFDTGTTGIPSEAAPTIIALIMLRIVGMWVFAAYAGRALAASQQMNEMLVARVEQLVADRDVKARLAIAEERRRVARELHDLVGHGLSIMTLQSGAVSSLVRRDPDRAGETLRLIERMGDQAKQELDDLVRLLGPVGTPSPGAPRRISELVDDARAAGLNVTLDVRGDDRGGPLAVHAYRIVQEALTNARKYAPDSAVVVTLSHLDDAIEVGVVNDAAKGPRSTQDTLGGGHGLVGMRERVGLFGGELHAGSRPDGCFEIRARLPEPALT